MHKCIMSLTDALVISEKDVSSIGLSCMLLTPLNFTTYTKPTKFLSQGDLHNPSCLSSFSGDISTSSGN